MREVWWGVCHTGEAAWGLSRGWRDVAASPVRLWDAGQVLPWSLWPEPGPASTLRFSFFTFSFIFLTPKLFCIGVWPISNMIASDAQSGTQPSNSPPIQAGRQHGAEFPLLYSRFSNTLILSR